MSDTPETSNSEKPKFTFYVSKANEFRVIYGNGFFIQPDPLGGTRISVTCDRLPYEPMVVHEVLEAGKLGDIIEGQTETTITKIEREVQAEIATSDSQAIALFQNLQTYLEWRGLIRRKPSQESVKE